MKVAVVGHIEWGRFMKVEALPRPGEIIHTSESWQEVAGGGSVSVMQLAKLADSCMFFTAVGGDEVGQRSIAELKNAGVEVYATVYDERPTSEAFVFIDDNKERTITATEGLWPDGRDGSLPWSKLASADAVFFASGNAEALLAARQAEVLVSTARTLPVLQEVGVDIDALVCSARDSGEAYLPHDLSPRPKYVVTTNGIQGGYVDNGVTYQAEAVAESAVIDSYGCGDSFVAGLTFALGKGLDLAGALQLAASCGAEATQRRGAFGNG